MIPLMEYLRGHWMELLIGSLFVCWYGYQRFNTPPSTRFSTTPRQYNAASAFYLLTLLAGYVAVSYSPALFGLTKFAGLNESLNNLSPPLIVALLMTLFMPRLPVLSDIDQRLREFYWEQASIPHEVLAVKDTLGKARYVVPAELRPEVRRELIKHDVPEQWITFDEAQLRFSPWVKVSALRLEMEAWEFDDAYRAYVRRIRSDRQRLNEQCEEFYREAAEHAKYVDRTSAAGTAVDDYVLQRAQQRLDKQADLLLDRLYLLIAQGVVYCGNSDQQRTNRLHRSGFAAEYKAGARRPGLLVLIFMIVVLMFFLCFALFMPGSDRTLPQRLLDSTRIAAVYCLSIAAALGVHRWRSGTRYDLSSYAWAAMIAVALGFAANVIFFRMEYATWGAVGWRLEQTWPYLGLALLTSSLLGVMLDVRGGAWLRVLDVLLFGIGSAIAACAVHELLQQVPRVPYTDAFYVKPIDPRPVPPVMVLVFMASIVGALTGALVPSWYRDQVAASERDDADPARDHADDHNEKATA